MNGFWGVNLAQQLLTSRGLRTEKGEGCLSSLIKVLLFQQKMYSNLNTCQAGSPKWILAIIQAKISASIIYFLKGIHTKVEGWCTLEFFLSITTYVCTYFGA